VESVAQKKGDRESKKKTDDDEENPEWHVSSLLSRD
jgi:hypothetical protein